MFQWVMNLFGKKSQESGEKGHSMSEEARLRAAFEKIKADMEKLRKEQENVAVELAGHNNQLKEHTKDLERQEKSIEKQDLKMYEQNDRIKDLEHSLKNSESSGRQAETPRRLDVEQPKLVASKLVGGQSMSEIDWTSLTPQEKRIVSVFAENKDMSLSYEDVGKVLNKASSTIKNQMKKLELKGKLFEESRDHEQRKRFSLRSDIRLGKN